jgi:hypothetical protein
MVFLKIRYHWYYNDSLIVAKQAQSLKSGHSDNKYESSQSILSQVQQSTRQRYVIFKGVNIIYDAGSTTGFKYDNLVTNNQKILLI